MGAEIDSKMMFYIGGSGGAPAPPHPHRLLGLRPRGGWPAGRPAGRPASDRYVVCTLFVRYLYVIARYLYVICALLYVICTHVNVN